MQILQDNALYCLELSTGTEILHVGIIRIFLLFYVGIRFVGGSRTDSLEIRGLVGRSEHS